MIAFACVALSGTCFFLSFGAEAFWPLAWLAPVPVLWLAFTRRGVMFVFLCAASAHALGGLYLVQAYVGVLPPAILALAIAIPALCFALAVLGAAFAAHRLGHWAGVFAFAVLWTALDYALALGPDGTALSPAYSQVAAPWLIQSSALFGVWSITFLLGVVSAGLAAAWAHKQLTYLAFAAVLFLANAGYGALRVMTAPRSAEVQVGLIADDRFVDAAFAEDAASAVAVVQRHDEVSRDLARRGASIIVWPEKIAVLSTPWRSQVLTSLQRLADETRATIIAGFDERADERRNRAYVFSPGAAAPAHYDKRHLVQGLEARFSVGGSPFQFAAGHGVAICKDMDFPSTLRADAQAGRLTMVFAPAWDFDRDAWPHGRMAILRGVENGFSVARAAKQGLLTLSDAYGRRTAQAQSSSANAVSLVGRLQAGPGATLYTRIGDVFAWACIVLAGLLMAGAALARPRG
jgi:apolipoprotein N-acyltransferase